MVNNIQDIIGKIAEQRVELGQLDPPASWIFQLLYYYQFAWSTVSESTIAGRSNLLRISPIG